MKNFILSATAALLISVAAGPATADFEGFDPATHDGSMFPAENLMAMVAAAMEVSPPRNGETYVIGFANLQRDIPFCALVEQGILENAEAAGIEVVVADNRLDGATALANAESFITRNVDFVIEFQTDAEFGAVIMNNLNQAGIPVVAIDIPMPGAVFFGVNNPRAGFMGGSYLAQAAVARHGMDAVMEGYFIEGELPQSGPIPMMRTEGQMAGFRAALPAFPEDQILTFDSRNTLEESFTQTNNLLSRIPEGVPIMGTAINDQAATGILRAAQQDGREMITVVGLGADEGETLASEPDFVAAVGSFPERYGNSLIPIAMAMLAEEEVPDAVLINHQMVTPANICDFNASIECQDIEVIDYSFPEEGFAAHLEALRSDPDLADVQNLIPTQ
ncbi:sugar ABC transporter substrate-binding protein [Jannaschia sp. CCS1]|uniref:sugar ABC transporter substrate-binding protein n=1 Tax=Jannaschia sp. (strain CCS1) TaxID=290400 RepID=UPI00006C0096|nr:sugar ABC transporter substrate-binding protein [Jannaschia sp. CCS1]ABD56011.1 monosaccharide ABC transporter substrate-binding protein, CUT2 family [Jannaschia sp. CCS1]